MNETINQYFRKRPFSTLNEHCVLSPLPNRRTNKTFTTKTPDGECWVVKFCRGFDGAVAEICEREALTSLLGRLLDVPIVDAWSISSNCDEVRDDPDTIQERCVLMPFLDGSTVAEQKERAASSIRRNPSVVADVFAFMHWIGDEDRGLDDVMLVDGQLVLIDNGLCGPRKGSRLRGYHPHPNVYNDNRITKKCYGGGKSSLVGFVLRDLELPLAPFCAPDAMQRIEALSDDVVANVSERLGLESYVAEALIGRKKSLRKDYSEWFEKAMDLCRADVN